MEETEQCQCYIRPKDTKKLKPEEFEKIPHFIFLYLGTQERAKELNIPLFTNRGTYTGNIGKFFYD